MGEGGYLISQVYTAVSKSVILACLTESVRSVAHFCTSDG
jgi:hypothetical protein